MSYITRKTPREEKFKYHIEVGALFRNTIRNSLKKLSFEHPEAELEVLETKYFLYSEFTIYSNFMLREKIIQEG